MFATVEKYIGRILSQRSLSGGDINLLVWLKTDKGEFALKHRNEIIKGMYAAEVHGIKTLQQAGLPVPEVVAWQNDFLLMEFLQRGSPRHKEAGRALAKMHLIEQKQFGLEQDNFIGSLSQKNNFHDNWILFFQEQRLQVQLNLFLPKDHSDRKLWRQLFSQLKAIIDYPVKPSLLHGDLWSGNLFSSKDGAVFIDPAVYVGDRYIELAFTELFGGFSSEFYSGYQEVYPIGKEYRRVKSLYQLYPLLVHANLFGGHYYATALRHAKSYLR